MTPAALSHQIRALEEQLGLPLFHRRTRAIELTDAGRLIYPGLHAGFESVRGAIGAARSRARRATSWSSRRRPGLTAKWLMPRLWRFLHAHPDIDARVSASMKLADFAADGVDVAIRLSKRQASRTCMSRSCSTIRCCRCARRAWSSRGCAAPPISRAFR